MLKSLGDATAGGRANVDGYWHRYYDNEVEVEDSDAASGESTVEERTSVRGRQSASKLRGASLLGWLKSAVLERAFLEQIGAVGVPEG